MNNTEKQITILDNLLKDIFNIEAVYRQNEKVVFSLTTPFDRTKVIKHTKDRLKLAGYSFIIDEKDDIILLTIDPTPKNKIPLINIILFITTFFTIYFIPVFIKNLDKANFNEILESTITDISNGAGLIFTFAMISILFVHEMGHYIASRRRNIVTSWPYFIPAPNFIGTFGAIIKSKSPFWNRRDLIEVGAWGPVAGWVVAFFWLSFGLTQSSLIPLEQFGLTEMSFSLTGESLLMKFLTLNIIGVAPDGYFYHLSEAAFAGWVGLLVTAINMLPIGQLDGGHIVYGLFEKKQHLLGKFAMVGLILLGFQSTVWWMFAAFGLIFGVNHPPTLNDSKPISKSAKTLGIISLIIMFISFTPIPFR